MHRIVFATSSPYCTNVPSVQTENRENLRTCLENHSIHRSLKTNLIFMTCYFQKVSLCCETDFKRHSWRQTFFCLFLFKLRNVYFFVTVKEWRMFLDVTQFIDLVVYNHEVNEKCDGYFLHIFVQISNCLFFLPSLTYYVSSLYFVCIVWQ